MLAGALARPVDQAVLLFRGETPEVAESFARDDPHVVNGLLDRWEVRPWATVVGDGSSPRDSEGRSAPPVAHVWRGVCRSGGDAQAYLTHLDEDVLPTLDRIEGFLEATVMRRPVEGDDEFIVLTLWKSMESIRAFAGDDVERAVIAPRAQELLTDADRTVRHYHVCRG